MIERDGTTPTQWSELEDLRQRLADAEATLAAIAAGQVDAVVVSGTAGARIFVLESADHPYRLLVEQLQEGVAILTVQGDVIFANRRLADLLQRPAASLSGAGFKTFVTVEDEPIFQQLLARALQGPVAGEVALNVDGQPGVAAHLSLSHLVVGNTQALSVIVSDLTEQKRSAGIIAAQRLTQSVLDQVLEAIVACDWEGRIVRANAAALALGAAPVVGLAWDQAFALVPAAADGADAKPSTALSDLVTEALDGRKIAGLTAVLTRADTAPLDVLLSAGPLRDDQGRIVGCLLTLMDITERKRSEARLRVSEERLRLATQVSGYGFHDYDIVGQQAYGTPELRQLLGIGPEQPLTLELIEGLLDPEDRQRVVAGIFAALDPHSSGEFVDEFRIRKGGAGETRWLYNRSLTLFDHGREDRRARRVVGVVVDVTDRKRADLALLRAAQRAEALQWVATHLSAARTSEQIIESVLVQGVAVLEAAAAAYVHLDSRNDLVVSQTVGFEPEVVLPEFPLTAAYPLAEAVRERRLVTTDSFDDLRERYPHAAPQRQRTGHEASAYVPLIVHDRTLGGLAFSFASVRRFDFDDQAFLLTLADLCAQALERARLYEQARALNATLEQRVIERTAELEQSRRQLRDLNHHLDTVREDERTRLSREIHDQLGGTLTGLKMDVGYIRRHWGKVDLDLMERITDLSRNLDNTVQLVREIATDLRPGLLDEFGLPAAIEWQLQAFKTRTGLQCELNLVVEEFTWRRDCATALFRVFQEALTNITRHAQATRVSVRLEQEGTDLVLRIVDNGRGIQDADLKGKRSLGVLGMQERITAYAGELAFERALGGGTAVVIRIPLDRCRRPDPAAA